MTAKKEEVENVEQDLENAEAKDQPANEPKKEEDLQDRLVRLAADFDNFRKRVHKEKAEYVRYANENLVRELLPILDNFERALEHLDTSNDPSAIGEGVKLIFSQIQNALSRFGVRSESASGKIFDPLTHEAVSHVYSNEVPAHTVIQEHQKAYFLQDRLIRPALVTVSKGPENQAEGESDTDEKNDQKVN